MRRGALAALGGWVLSALGAAMLMWVAVADGRPAVFSDTALYYDQAEYLFEALHLVAPAQAVEPPGDPAALPSRPGAPNVSAEIDGARSPLYGAPVYLLQRLGGLWLVAFAQGWAAAGAVYLLYRAAAPAAPRWGYLALMAGLAALTPLPFFAGWIMPDLFAGVAGCGLILLLVYPDRLGAAGRAGTVLLTGFGLAVHRSNLLDAAAVAVAAAAAAEAWRPALACDRQAHGPGGRHRHGDRAGRRPGLSAHPRQGWPADRHAPLPERAGAGRRPRARLPAPDLHGTR